MNWELQRHDESLRGQCVVARPTTGLEVHITEREVREASIHETADRAMRAVLGRRIRPLVWLSMPVHDAPVTPPPAFASPRTAAEAREFYNVVVAKLRDGSLP